MKYFYCFIGTKCFIIYDIYYKTDQKKTSVVINSIDEPCSKKSLT